jgi:hypothetical protein
VHFWLTDQLFDKEGEIPSGLYSRTPGLITKLWPCSAGWFLAYKPVVADLLWEKNTVPRLISRADKLSRTWGIYKKNHEVYCFHFARNEFLIVSTRRYSGWPSRIAIEQQPEHPRQPAGVGHPRRLCTQRCLIQSSPARPTDDYTYTSTASCDPISFH